MKKSTLAIWGLFTVALLPASKGFAQTSGTIPADLKQVKNVIMMIPDGTSTSVLSLARWYNSYNSNDFKWLYVDGVVCGLVKTHSSDAPIGDSAPTGSTYASGVVAQAGCVSTYPEKTPNDIVPVDASLTNSPAFTILEAAKQKGMATGLVVTCEFPHATPADFSAHTPNRSDYAVIAPQMVYNNIDVVFGGGEKYLLPEQRKYLAQNGWDTIFYDYNKFMSFDGKKAWALFAPEDVPYDFDRDPNAVPSLGQMTKKALNILSKNDKGFFLMVEGSKVDFAAHGNDPVGIISEFLAFDKAVKEALEFAKKDGNTAIVICPDHGNSAVSIGNQSSTSGYNRLSKKDLFGPLMGCKLTCEGFAKKLVAKGRYDENFVREQFAQQMGFNDITLPELQTLKSPMNGKKEGDITKAVVKIVNARTFIGFTTGGHTGEDVFLGCYHPQQQELHGVVLNTDINRYMCELLGVGNLSDSTKKYFVSHKTVFPESEYTLTWDKSQAAPTLTVTSKATKKVLTAKAFENKVAVANNAKDKNGKNTSLSTVIVYVTRNDAFYLPASVKDLLK